MTTDTFNLNSVSANELTERLNRRMTRQRHSKGFKIVQQFLDSGDVAATVTSPDKETRNKVLVSIKNYLGSGAGDGVSVWAKVSGPTEILLINLDKADADTRKAYTNRPKVGRSRAKNKK